VVGTISSVQGNVEVVVERVARGKSGSLWLFSNETLDHIPALYEEVNVKSLDSVLPSFLVDTKLGGVALFEWAAVLLGMPAAWFLTGLLNRILTPLVGSLLRRVRKRPDLPEREIVPIPVRLLLMAVAIDWLLSDISLPLLARQFWSSVASILTIAACVLLFISLDDKVEQYLRHGLVRRGNMGAASVLRLGRRILDVLAIFVGLVVALYHFGLNPTAALAGLGVGGIAVALAAQKTLENVLGGISIIFDRVVQVGDTLLIGDTQGTVEDIGLRSTRIRTRDRTLVSVPNGQVANVKLENLSARDKFWFHPRLSLRYDTTPEQLGSVVRDVRKFLEEHAQVERDSVQLRFLQFGKSSLDLDVSAYVLAADWNPFLDIQGDLLVNIRQIVCAAGAQIAFEDPVYVSGSAALVKSFQASDKDESGKDRKETDAQ
jgi:MscS family membrane protein